LLAINNSNPEDHDKHSGKISPQSFRYKLPESLPFEESAIIGCALFTGYGAVKNAGKAKVV
jgi:Zn-dependent alcohol dehydrogenase